jgi:tetratricopeptide (TPR) repeat protein
MTNPDPFVSALRAAKLVIDAEFLAEQRDWESADQRFRDAVSVDSSPASRIAYGVYLARQERYFEGISIFTSVLDGTDRSAIGVVCHNLASIYREVGDFDLARRFQWRATLLQEDAGPEDLLGMANDALACRNDDGLSAGRHEGADALVMTARQMSEDENGECGDGDLVATTGLVAAALDSREEGLLIVFAAYRRHQADHDLRGMGTDLLNMAMLFGELHRYRAERACVLRASRCFEQAPAPFSSRRARQELQRIDRMQAIRAFDATRN